VVRGLPLILPMKQAVDKEIGQNLSGEGDGSPSLLGMEVRNV